MAVVFQHLVNTQKITHDEKFFKGEQVDAKERYFRTQTIGI